MENIMWEVIEVIFAVVHIVLIFLFVQAFLGTKKNTPNIIKTLVIIVVFGARILHGFVLMDNFIAMPVIATFSAFLIGITFFNSKVYIAGIAAFFSTLVGGASEMIAVFIIVNLQGVAFLYVAQFSSYRAQAETLSGLIFLVMIALVKIFRKGSMGVANKKTMIVLCSMPFFSILAIQQYALHFTAMPYAPTAFEVIPILSLIVINVFVFVLVEMLMRQNERNQKLLIVEVQNDAHKTHIRQLTEYQKQIRTMSHDFRQQVHEFYTLSAEKQYDKLHTKLTELSNRRSENLIVETKNIMLDSILTSKVELAETHNIDFKKKLDVQAELGYITSEICVLLGNALDNAIEACIRADDNKFIGMELTATPKQFLCHIINTVGIMPKLMASF